MNGMHNGRTRQFHATFMQQVFDDSRFVLSNSNHETIINNVIVDNGYSCLYGRKISHETCGQKCEFIVAIVVVAYYNNVVIVIGIVIGIGVAMLLLLQSQSLTQWKRLLQVRVLLLKGHFRALRMMGVTE